MAFGAFRRLTTELVFDFAFGVDVILTRPAPNDTPITTKGVWQGPLPTDQPVGDQIYNRDPRRLMALRRDEVPVPERGSIIEAPENPDGVPVTWVLEGTDTTESDFYLVALTQKTTS